MIEQPKDTRGNNEAFLKSEKSRISILNEILGDIQLTPEEEKTLIWLCGLDDYTINNIVSVLRKIKSQ